MNGNDHHQGPIWEDEDRNRRASVLLRRIAVVAIAAVVIVCVATPLAVEPRVEQAGQDRALEFTATLSLAPRAVIPTMVDAADVQAIIANESGTVDVFGVDESSVGQEFTRWRTQVRNMALAPSGTQFVSKDPSGDSWWHSAVAFRSDEILIVSTPRASGMELARTIQRFILLSGLATISLIVIGWALAYRRLVVPVRSLVDASEDLRVRGSLRSKTDERLQSVREVPDELHVLARALKDLEQESLKGHRQVDALLAAAGALGGSLDQSEILHSTLGYLELVLGAERSAILQYDVHAKSCEVVAVRGHTGSWEREMTRAEVDQYLPTMRAMRERVPVQVSNTESKAVSPGLRDRGRRHGYRSLLAVPLTEDLALPTVLVMHSSHAKTYSFDEIELSKSFASIAGAALRNAELFERTDADLQRQTSRLESIVESVEQGLIVEGSNGLALRVNGAIRYLLPTELRSLEGRPAGEVVEAVLRHGNAPPSAAADIEELEEGANHWVDIALTSDEQQQTFRVRKFVVRNAHGAPIGRGQTWTDVSRDRELERMKSGLLAAVSHEFRTPLALIKGYATTLLADDVEWNIADQRQFLSLVSAEADRLTDLVQRILDMRRIDAGMVSLQLMPVRLSVLIEAVQDSLPAEQHRIVVDELPEMTVDVDAARIVTALRNLVENACKYSPHNEPVTVSAVFDDDVVEIVVKDRGPGIDPVIRDRLFDTFVRGESGLAALHGGVGLGLALSRGFVEAHDGRLYVSESDDDGAEFRIRLPRKQSIEQPEFAR